VINAAYIEKDGCSKCARAAIVLQALQVEYPNLKVTTFNNVRDAALIEEMGDYLQLGAEKHLVAPAIYIGSDALIDDQVNSTDLRAVLARYNADGAPAFWEQLNGVNGKVSILQRFRSMGPLAVVLAALIDGINPCAFATILFFISYLTISKRPRRALLVTGLLFSLGVFTTYLAIGLGAMSLLRLASKVHVLGLVLFGVMGAGCLVLAGLSLRDYLLARQGRLKEMTLTLSDSARDKIKKRIRVASGAVAGAAFVTGMFVSLVELACTGQVYLPTISFVISIPELRGTATAYLILYNLIFIFPLILILVLAVYGISASRVQEWFVRNVARTKLVMAVIFVVLGVLLLLQVFGLY
jgi:cytochrome c biogenesis protein CcdA